MGDGLSGIVPVTLAFDSGPGIGLGHRRRIESIASALRDLGVQPEMRALGDAALPMTGYSLVVDSYRFRADDSGAFAADRVTAIDDLCRDLAVALLIDPSPGAEPKDHRLARQVLAGASYAIVDPTLSTLDTRDPSLEVREVLVASGASDRAGYGVAMARSLRSALPDDVVVSLAVGPWADEGDTTGLEVIRLADGLAPRLAMADIVVTAGGVTLLEAVRLGRPTVGVVLYPNQRRQTEGVGAAGAALVTTMGDVVPTVLRLLNDVALRTSLAAAATNLIDGQGPRRVAEAIVALR
jgi:spore coat polysaccharide biosynthesis predicted glycosyltransferase SpsG